jgi:uncharacterized protein (UPF0548 family)
MIALTRPSEARIRTFLARQGPLPYSYAEVGATGGRSPAGYVVDHNRVRLGEGPEIYGRACEALRGWAMFRLGWVEIRPAGASIAEGTTVGILARGLGLWALFACRIARVIETRGPVESFGFAYGTLPGHLLGGEERFLVEWDRGEGSVWFDILALSRPASLAGRVGYPLVRRLQRRFAPDALRAMVRAVKGEEP